MSVMFFIIASPYHSGTKTARLITILRPHKRVVTYLLVFAYSAFLLIHPDAFGRLCDLILGAPNLILQQCKVVCDCCGRRTEVNA